MRLSLEQTVWDRKRGALKLVFLRGRKNLGKKFASQNKGEDELFTFSKNVSALAHCKQQVSVMQIPAFPYL